MSYNQNTVKAKIEFIEVTDRSLKRYWPNGVTRVLLEFRKPALNNSQEVVFKSAK
jgi:hypothetical protein